MQLKKTYLQLCFLMVVTFALSSCNNNSDSSSATDSSGIQAMPDTSSVMMDTTITDSASTRPIKNPPGKTTH